MFHLFIIDFDSRCEEHCSYYGYVYFGLELRMVCSCGNDPPPEEYKKADLYCDLTCPGDPSAKCGGSNHKSNVYEL